MIINTDIHTIEQNNKKELQILNIEDLIQKSNQENYYKLYSEYLNYGYLYKKNNTIEDIAKFYLEAIEKTTRLRNGLSTKYLVASKFYLPNDYNKVKIEKKVFENFSEFYKTLNKLSYSTKLIYDKQETIKKNKKNLKEIDRISDFRAEYIIDQKYKKITHRIKKKDLVFPITINIIYQPLLSYENKYKLFIKNIQEEQYKDFNYKEKKIVVYDKKKVNLSCTDQIDIYLNTIHLMKLNIVTLIKIYQKITNINGPNIKIKKKTYNDIIEIKNFNKKNNQSQYMFYNCFFNLFFKYRAVSKTIGNLSLNTCDDYDNDNIIDFNQLEQTNVFKKLSTQITFNQAKNILQKQINKLKSDYKILMDYKKENIQKIL